MPAICRRSTRGPLDEISMVLGTDARWDRYFDKALSVSILGPHSRDHITVSRFYCTLTPPVAVDFEPPKHEAKFYVEEKQKYFMEKGIIYIPIFLTEQLSPDQFKDRWETARGVTHRGGKILAQNVALRGVVLDEDLPSVLREPEVVAFIDQEAIARVDAHAKTKKKFGGAIKNRYIEKLKLEVIGEVSRAARAGRLGQLLGSRDLTATMR